jgi:DNA (cytosine-5)-methyltransferase 1
VRSWVSRVSAGPADRAGRRLDLMARPPATGAIYVMGSVHVRLAGGAERVSGVPRPRARGPRQRRWLMARPRLLDLFCGAGGAAMGYHRAGFDVTGVDIRPQPRYPFQFVQADAMTVLHTWDDFCWGWGDFDAIHASPPCQHYIRSGMFDRSKHPDLIHAVCVQLEATGKPWVVENVPGAPMRADYRLCGCMFGLEVQRQRWFETSWRGFDLRPPCHHLRPAVGVYGHPRGRGAETKPWGWGTFEDWQRAMQIDWMAEPELAQAVPPAYTEYIGAQLLREFPAQEADARGSGGQTVGG